MMSRRLILGFALFALVVGYVEMRLPEPVSAQGSDAVYERLSVTGAVKLEAFRGQIAAFNATCPADWNELTALRGRVIVGLVDGGTLAQSVGSALTGGELRRGGTSHSGPTYTRPYATHDDPNFTHVHSHRYSDGLRNTVTFSYVVGSNSLTVANDASTFTTSSTGDADAVTSLDDAGGVTMYGGGVSGGGGTDQLPPAPYVQFRYCEYQP